MSRILLNDFIRGIETVLPGLKLMGDMLEACGFKCEIAYMEEYDCQVGCSWKQGDMDMTLTLVLGCPDEIVWLQLWDGTSNNIVVQAMDSEGTIDWSVIFCDSVDTDSALAQLENDIRDILPEEEKRGSDSVGLPNKLLVHEVVNMMAAVFKRQQI